MIEAPLLESVINKFITYKSLGDKTLDQLSEPDCFIRSSEAVNSIAMIVNHLRGNMLSRWTNFLTEDGEKPWRNRAQEFEDFRCSKEALVKKWEEGWACLSDALRSLKPEDLARTVHIRQEPLAVYDAILRQLMHYSYHVGQIVIYAKIIKGAEWKPLSD